MTGSQTPLLPDPVPLREALRGLRHLLRRGGETLRETLDEAAMDEVLPKPAAGLARSVLREAGGIVRSMDEAASGLAKTVLGGADLRPDTRLEDCAPGDPRLAAMIYTALAKVLARLGIGPVFISEALAARVLADLRETGGDEAQRAAELTLALLAARVIRDAGPARPDVTRANPPRSASPSGFEAVAVFAVMLWLQSARAAGEDLAALEAASDLAQVLAPEIDAARGDAMALAALYRRYAAHV